MSHFYLAIKNCLYVREKKALHCSKRQRQLYRDRPNKGARISKTYAMEGFEKFLDDEKAELVLQDYYISKALVNFSYVFSSHYGPFS